MYGTHNSQSAVRVRCSGARRFRVTVSREALHFEQLPSAPPLQCAKRVQEGLSLLLYSFVSSFQVVLCEQRCACGQVANRWVRSLSPDLGGDIDKTRTKRTCDTQSALKHLKCDTLAGALPRYAWGWLRSCDPAEHLHSCRELEDVDPSPERSPCMTRCAPSPC